MEIAAGGAAGDPPPPFADGGRRLLYGAGWIACSFDTKGQLHARWCLPGDAGRYTQAI